MTTARGGADEATESDGEGEGSWVEALDVVVSGGGLDDVVLSGGAVEDVVVCFC